MHTDLKFLNALHSIPGVGPATLRALKARCVSWEMVWQADALLLNEVKIPTETQEAFLWKRKSLSPDREMERLIKEGIWMVTEEDQGFPSLLKEIAQSPLVLYGKGNARLLREAKPSVAVVGTRKPTSYGNEVAENITKELSPFATIISGLATGIDTKAHVATLEARGVTFAVLGSGMDRESLFPAENFHLAERIIKEGGLVLSEHPPGTPARKENFPRRNRIISGLSKGVVVVEARERSGALITARFALEQGRDVFAVPGPIFSSASSGPNHLIQEGAALVQCAKDILEAAGIPYTEKEGGKYSGSLGEHEEKIFALLADESISVDHIKEVTELPTQVIVTSLSMLELKGVIKNVGGDSYRKI